MKLRICFLAILSIVFFSLRAQDKIYKNDGAVIDAKVITVGTTIIIYQRPDKTNSLEYTITKREVSRIQYGNGITDNFKGIETKKAKPRHANRKTENTKFVKMYGDNVISVIAGAYTAGIDGTINDAGLGLCYERQLNERGHISFSLPLLVSFSSDKDFSNRSIYNYNYPYRSNPDFGNYYSFYVMPGVKFYPASSNYRVRYSMGVSFFTIFGSEPYAVYDNNNQTGVFPKGNWSYAVYGFMISNSLNIAASKHLLMSIDLGTGIPISDNRHADNNGGLDNLIGPWIQFGGKLGYRF